MCSYSLFLCISLRPSEMNHSLSLSLSVCRLTTWTINVALRMYRFTTNVDYQQTVENLKVKLSLKKQVWSGISNSVDTHHSTAAASAASTTADGNYQPLSWGISVVNKKKPFKLDANEELFAWVQMVEFLLFTLFLCVQIFFFWPLLFDCLLCALWLFSGEKYALARKKTSIVRMMASFNIHFFVLLRSLFLATDFYTLSFVSEFSSFKLLFSFVCVYF